MAVQTTYELRGGAAALPFQSQGVAFNHKFTVDTAVTGVTAADVLKLMEIPAGTLIENIVVNVLTEEGGTATLDIGDYTTSSDAAVDADGYFDGLDADTAGVTQSKAEVLVEGTPNVVRAYSRDGKYYPDALRYIGVLVNNTMDAGIFEVMITGRNLANVGS